MQKIDRYILKGKLLISLSVFFMITSISLAVIEDQKQNKQDYQISYEYVNIKDMATAAVATKKETTDTNIIDTLFKPQTSVVEPTETPLEPTVEEVALPAMKNTVATLEAPKPIWYLPTEVGVITQYPSYGHVALDITSYRGAAETVYPVANGTISSIYTDSAGAKIVTIHHYINNTNYTSQYVHLSSYAPDLYVGKTVTINDWLGKMGTTGRSTGVHLHFALIDCSLYDPNDTSCATLYGFFNYASKRQSEGYTGLQGVMNVPASWSNR